MSGARRVKHDKQTETDSRVGSTHRRHGHFYLPENAATLRLVSCEDNVPRVSVRVGDNFGVAGWGDQCRRRSIQDRNATSGRLSADSNPHSSLTQPTLHRIIVNIEYSLTGSAFLNHTPPYLPTTKQSTPLQGQLQRTLPGRSKRPLSETWHRSPGDSPYSYSPHSLDPSRCVRSKFPTPSGRSWQC